ncbi:MAG: hypothetical protein RLZZ46_853, partial [Bacteroidota bacterium]
MKKYTRGLLRLLMLGIFIGVQTGSITLAQT